MTGRERGPLGPGTSGMLESRRISSSTPLKRSGPQPAYNPHKETLRTSWTRLLSRARLSRGGSRAGEPCEVRVVALGSH